MKKHAKRVFPKLEEPVPELEFAEHAFPKSPSPIVFDAIGRPVLELMRWGVAWQDERGKAKFVTNARDDSLRTVALWRESVKHRRCLIPLIGYFEPGTGPVGARGELLFTIRDRETFFVAGVWDTDPGTGARTYAMVTTSPNSYTARFHDRQPVVLTDEDARAWLGSEPLEKERLVALTRPPSSEIMQHVVIPAVPKPDTSRAGTTSTNDQLDLFPS